MTNIIITGAIDAVAPNAADMHAHVLQLFGSVSSECADGLIELAWTDTTPDAQGRYPLGNAKLFPLDQIDKLIEKACELNVRQMCNLYIGAALRRPQAAPSKRCGDEDFLATTAIWLDIDDAEAAKNAPNLFGDQPPTFGVITGRTPNLRVQYWWVLDQPLRDKTVLTEILKAFSGRFGGDRSVTNPSRVMRLAGSVAWPTKAGRVAEMTSIASAPDATSTRYLREELLPPPLVVDMPVPAQQANALKAGPEDSHPEDIRRALSDYWNPDEYGDWVDAALALHTYPQGCELWLEWAGRSPKFRLAENQKKWAQTQPSEGISVRSIFQRVPRDVLSSWGKARWQPATRSSAWPTGSQGLQPNREDTPTPLYRPLAEPTPYPLDALGPVLGPAARAILDITQAPDAIAAQSVLGVASLAVQAHADIVIPATGQAKPCSLFLVTVAESGERKSAVDNEALRAVRAREAELRELAIAEQQNFLNQRTAVEAARKVAQKKGNGDYRAIKAALDALPPEPQPPLSPHLVSGEPTYEGLYKHFQGGHASLGIFDDEGGGFINGHGLTDENRLRTSAGLSKFWDGSTIKRVRASDGNSSLVGRRLAIHLMAQPQAASRLLCDPTLRDQGLLSRILVAAPVSTAGTRFQRQPQAGCELVVAQFAERIQAILTKTPPLVAESRNEVTPRRVELDGAAQRDWRAFADHVERQLGAGRPFEPIRGFANKLAEHALRLAAVIALVEDIHITAIGTEHFKRGIQLAEYYAHEALRLFDAGFAKPELQQAETLRKWLLEVWEEPMVSIRIIVRCGPNSIRDKATATAAVKLLTEHGWLIGPAPGVVEGKSARTCWKIVREELP